VRFVLRPAADKDLDAQAAWYGEKAGVELGHRFLIAAHETFALLATQPNIGWHPRLWRPPLKDMRVFRVRRFEKLLILYLPRPDGVEILRVIHGSQNVQELLSREMT
jgi:toxin ParE1/3/4